MVYNAKMNLDKRTFKNMTNLNLIELQLDKKTPRKRRCVFSSPVLIVMMVGLNIGLVLVWCWFSAAGRANTMNSSTWSPPIELSHIGYMGTWESFCDIRLINKEFRFYPPHEMRKLRLEICMLRAQRNITRESLAPFVGYKYCAMMRHCADDFLEKLVDKFSLGNEQNKDELMAAGPIIDATPCFKQVAPVFEKKCIAAMNPFFRMFHQILARACTAKWLKTEQVLSHIAEVCDGIRLTSDINWGTIINSIYIK